MSEIIDRVAKTLQATLLERGFPTISAAVVNHLAAAVIEAMREPTAAMIDKGYDHVDYGGTDIEAAWKDMVDAALK